MLNNINRANPCPSFSAFKVEPKDKTDTESMKQFVKVVNNLRKDDDISVSSNGLRRLFGLPDNYIKSKVKPENNTPEARLDALDKEEKRCKEIEELYPLVKVKADTKDERTKIQKETAIQQLEDGINKIVDKKEDHPVGKKGPSAKSLAERHFRYVRED